MGDCLMYKLLPTFYKPGRDGINIALLFICYIVKMNSCRLVTQNISFNLISYDVFASKSTLKMHNSALKHLKYKIHIVTTPQSI